MSRSTLQKAFELHQAGRLDEAERIYEKFLTAAPEHAETLHLLGCLRLQRGRIDEALDLLRRAVDHEPLVGRYHEHLADAHHRAGRADLAESEARLALRCDSSLHRPRNLLGLLALERGEAVEAIDWFSQALRAKVPYADAMVNLSVALNRTGEFELSKDYAELALKVEPSNPKAWTNLGMALRGLRRLADAKAAFERAGAFPMARFNLGYCLLLEDDLARGLPLCEERKRLLGLGLGKGMTIPEWYGGDAKQKRLLVLHEQGLGDTILTARFLPEVRRRCRDLLVVVQPPLERLLAGAFPDLAFAAALPEGAADDFDLWCPAMSLPLLLGIDHADRIPNEPWIRLASARPRPAPAAAAGPGPARARVGLNWAGNPSYAYDAIRSTSLDHLRPLLAIEGIDWISLHKGCREVEAERLGLPQPLRDAADFADTAEVLAGLDCVVSTETAVPNLSAAMGIPTIVLTMPDYDWRWRSWYPGVTVCDQDSVGDWESAVAKAAAALRACLAARAAADP